MTPEQARELFSDAVEGELPPEQQRELDALLEGDPELRAELDEFRDMLELTRQAASEPPVVPDLLPGVQERLRRRSRGRFYGDRFSRRAGLGLLHPVALAVLMLAVLGAAWVALSVLDAVKLLP
ncbi:MAG: hypothetical protein PVI30_15395 [Myxococcales bacterium]|jgi:anti-sigma factor RsiW